MSKQILFILSILFFISCNTSTKTSDVPNTPTSGELKVFCEEGMLLHIKNQAYTFEKIYFNAKINVQYVNEKQAVEGLYNDSCKVIVISRCLSENELKQFKAKNIYPTQICVAKSALAFVVPVNSTDSVISTEKIKNIISGADTSYNMVFDNENSGTTRFLKDSILQGKPFGKNCFALKNTTELINHIGKNKNTIGALDYAWLSDLDDSISKAFLTTVKTLAVSTNGSKIAYMPDQSNIQTNDYPLCRHVYAIRRSAEFSLGTGFSLFIAGQKGQIMFLKQGLIPYVQPGRVVEINTEPLH
ncbi:MAG TPA: substrate-binding domain-containing protein [Bacteroidia bacterium]|nr:substrate-binding domain-containing protein [Bacteroidia bacterium]